MDIKTLLGKLGSGELSSDAVDSHVVQNFEKLSDLVEDESADVRAGMAILLSRTESFAKPEAFFPTLLTDSETRVVAETLWALEEKPVLAVRYVPLVVKILSNTDWKVRLPALTVLVKVAAENSLPKLIDWDSLLKGTVTDECEAVRVESALLLGYCPISLDSFDSLLKQFFADDSFDVRRSALAAARVYTPPLTLVEQLIHEGLRDTSYDVRIEACKLAGCYVGARKQFAATLRELGLSSDAELKRAAAIALIESKGSDE